MIINSKNTGKAKVDKLEVEMNELSKAKIEIKMNKAITFFMVNLMTYSISKLFAIIYNFEDIMPFSDLFIFYKGLINNICFIELVG